MQSAEIWIRFNFKILLNNKSIKNITINIILKIILFIS